MTTPKPGDFFLAPMPGRVGKGVQFGQFLNGEGYILFQHAGQLLENGDTIEAMPGGAIIGDINRWKPEELRWSSGLIELTDTQRTIAISTGYACKGVPYSFVDYAALAAHRFHIPTPGLKEYIEDSGHMICSQMVDYIYHRAGKQLFTDGRWRGYVTPGSLNMLLDDIEGYNLAMGV